MIAQDEIEIGHWWAPCCICDLQPVTSDEDRHFARMFVPFSGAWVSCDAAITELLSRRRYLRESDRQADITDAVVRYGERVRELVEP